MCTCTYTVEPLLKDTPELRTPLYKDTVGGPIYIHTHTKQPLSQGQLSIKDKHSFPNGIRLRAIPL